VALCQNAIVAEVDGGILGIGDQSISTMTHDEMSACFLQIRLVFDWTNAVVRTHVVTSLGIVDWNEVSLGKLVGDDLNAHVECLEEGDSGWGLTSPVGTLKSTF
jgi:hypothetical protein